MINEDENISKILVTVKGVVKTAKKENVAIYTAYKEMYAIIEQIKPGDNKYDNIIEYLKQSNTKFTETLYSVNAMANYSSELLDLCNVVFGNRCFKQMDDNNGTECKNIIIDRSIKS